MRRLHVVITTVLALLAGGCSTPAPKADAPASALLNAAPVAPTASTTVSPAVVLESTTPAPDPELPALQRIAPQLDPGVLALALQARQCAVASGDVDADTRLAVIDYSLPSTAKRLWVLDVANRKLLHHEYVAHGQGSGDNYATSFSNTDGSHQSSLGLFRTAETYIGSNGYSLRLDGLEPGYNDKARDRAIVMHGAWYVNPDLAAKQGRLGRSYGCPALREQVSRVVIDEIKQRNLLFAYADDAKWLDGTHDFACAQRSARDILADARRPVSGGFITASR